jgi:serine/threonine protein kinase
VFYARSADDRMEWVKTLRKGAHSFPIQEFYNVGKQIGKGRFSVVHSATHIRTGKLYAIKVIDKSKIAVDAREKEALRTEIAILKLVRHPTIIHMHEIFEAPSKLYIVMTLLRGGDLFDRIIARKRFPERTCMIILWRLLSAVKYLHDRGIVHRDLKPENILCGDEKDDTRVLIADFGLSKFASPEEVMNLPCGTLAYVAPEVLKLQGYSKAVDLWSLGVILYLLLRGGLPFDGKSKNEIIERTLHAKLSFRHEVWKGVSKHAIDLITRLLDKSPATRITIEAATAHPWFSNLTDEEKEIDEMDGDDAMNGTTHDHRASNAGGSGASSGAGSPAMGSPSLGPSSPAAPLMVSTSTIPNSMSHALHTAASSPTASSTRFGSITSGSGASTPFIPSTPAPNATHPSVAALQHQTGSNHPRSPAATLTILPQQPGTPLMVVQPPPNIYTPPPSLVTHHTASHYYPAIAAALSAAYQSPLIVTPTLAQLAASAPSSPNSSPTIATRTISHVFHGPAPPLTAITLPPVVVITSTPHAALLSTTPSSSPSASSIVLSTTASPPPPLVPSLSRSHSRTSSLIASGGVGLSYFSTPPESTSTTPYASAPASPMLPQHQQHSSHPPQHPQHHAHASHPNHQHHHHYRSPTPGPSSHHHITHHHQLHHNNTTINPHLPSNADSPIPSPLGSPISSRSPSPSLPVAALSQLPSSSPSSSSTTTSSMSTSTTTAVPAVVASSPMMINGIPIVTPPPAFLFTHINHPSSSPTSTTIGGGIPQQSPPIPSSSPPPPAQPSTTPLVISFAAPTRSVTPVGTSTIGHSTSTLMSHTSSSNNTATAAAAATARLFGHRSLPAPLTFTVPAPLLVSVSAPVTTSSSSSSSSAIGPSSPPPFGRPLSSILPQRSSASTTQTRTS